MARSCLFRSIPLKLINGSAPAGLATRNLITPASNPFVQYSASGYNRPCNFICILMGSQRGWSSEAAASRSFNESKISIGPRRECSEANDSKETGIVYYGPISSTIKKVKLLSLSTCCLSVSLGPVVTFMTSGDVNVILKGAIASSVIFFSASTTAALHWFVNPYIHKLRWQPGSDSFEVEMMSWLATYIPRTIRFSEIRPAQTNRPFVTFKAGDNFYFIDTEHCHNKALLAKLTRKSDRNLPSRIYDPEFE